MARADHPTSLLNSVGRHLERLADGLTVGLRGRSSGRNFLR